MSIKVGDVVFEKTDPDKSKWTVISISQVEKDAMIGQFIRDPSALWEYKAKRVLKSELKKV